MYDDKMVQMDGLIVRLCVFGAFKATFWTVLFLALINGVNEMVLIFQIIRIDASHR